jgi:hypothetical protein
MKASLPTPAPCRAADQSVRPWRHVGRGERVVKHVRRQRASRKAKEAPLYEVSCVSDGKYIKSIINQNSVVR